MTLEEFYLIVAYVLAGLLGVCVGSFLNVVIYRVPKGMRLDKPASHCPKCGYKLKPWDNIPVLSYLFLKGKCHSCKTKISFRYTAVELANMLAWLACVWMFWEKSIVFAVLCAIASSLLICVFFIDLEHMLIFDKFQIMLGVLAVLAVFFDPHYSWLSHVIGGAVGFAFFYGLYAIFYYFLKKDALGGGDIKLTAVMGLMLGWQRLLLSLLIASVTGSIILVILSRRQSATEDLQDGKVEEQDESQEAQEPQSKEYPFGPFLCAGFWVALLFGAPIIQWYISLLVF